MIELVESVHYSEYFWLNWRHLFIPSSFVLSVRDDRGTTSSFLHHPLSRQFPTKNKTENKYESRSRSGLKNLLVLTSRAMDDLSLSIRLLRVHKEPTVAGLFHQIAPLLEFDRVNKNLMVHLERQLMELLKEKS